MHSSTALSSSSTVMTNTSLLETSYCCRRDFLISLTSIRGILAPAPAHCLHFSLSISIAAPLNRKYLQIVK